MSAHNSVHHYENFPVASMLLPKHCVPAVQALYRFARTADDIADEGDLDFESRLQLLRTLQLGLTSPNTAGTDLIKDLAPFIAQGITPSHELNHLLLAFIQDVLDDQRFARDPTSIRYCTMQALLDYCIHSANPVGRMMLLITASSFNADTQRYSDSICTGLQLVNFWQDLSKDALRGRIYIPHDVFAQFNFPNSPASPDYTSMMQYLCDDAQTRLLAGLPLLKSLSGRFKVEIALTIAGGLRVLKLLKRRHYQTNSKPIKLGLGDALPIAWQAILWLTHPAPKPK